ncbi:MAG: DUF4294 domain-containing protein [Bacteroidetes bacterium]|nr:DUF4294 domain-containing protein [Bacteroidota bacterium]MBU1373227.1 DUF4294 domain-containing protein [Bacteroidota bacterium]MBU1486299.1 DUF4294 domain-containing protein [Bacteroidota bacterium]MBU1761290.1 DUF4294 domain-containing protein [Bacteroidota bacterium]MBU2045752.1 DUF4294 domain-containing protein [Bacteroidota bacterium]
MKTKVLFLFLTAMLMSSLSKAQQSYVKAGTNDTIKVATTNLNGEILPWIVLNEITIISTRTFKSKEDFDKYRRLRYNVLKVLPYARFAGQRYRQLERDLAVTQDKRKQKALVKGCEKEIKDLFNAKIKDLSISQGEVLIKLIDRETGNSSYELVQDMKGNVSAFVFQSIARIFGHDLKNKYDPDEDRDIENIVRSAGYYSYQ